MKNGNSIFQAIIALAVVALFILHFTDSKAGSESSNSTEATSAKPDSKFVYVRLDSLLNNYEYNKTLVSGFESRAMAANQNIMKRQQDLQEEIQAFQQMAGGLNIIERRRAQGDLEQRQNSFMMYRERALRELQAEEDSINTLVQEDMDMVIEQMQREMGFDYVLQYQGTLLYGDSLQDITADLVQRLNAKYAQTNADNSEE
ncbi:MAG: OmpH family outer membrane protein [Flavobacteriia bacterium]|nr:OmpH family outer membrane protein [Flavobacteriia bacterium]